MQKHDKNPNSEEMQKATRDNKRAVFTAKMMGLTAIEPEETADKLKSYTNRYVWLDY